MKISQYFVLGYFVLYLIILLKGIIFVKRKGLNPKGNLKNYGYLMIVGKIFTLLWTFIVITFIIYFDSRNWFYLFPFLDYNIFLILGYIIIGIGIIFEILSFQTLGDNFRISLPIEQTKLTKNGIYSIIRNPMVISIFLFSFGLLFIIPNFLCLFNLVGNLWLLNEKVNVEEKDLKERFGKDWEEYIKTTGKYFPRIFRKK